MATYVIVFAAFLIVVVGMSIGVMFKRKPIAGSCGGLNAISDADHCLICGSPVDKNSPLKERLNGECPRKKAAREKAEREAAMNAAE
ncbi:(Na+)-NQR maturation NqrM [Cohaesibacter haloalkalitolerans]|uniref:(Na+)-NQR maturation NqrM n=1 Tax=Cohaesibacter haloalkalitolerans TaxID=1162980 RepID=UPI000E652FE6|nr:(Na+)-NQR maturation NqrM [Cohaesibacter haloalkalitolerans]